MHTLSSDQQERLEQLYQRVKNESKTFVGYPCTCNFDYSGALTEAVLLGNVAYRTGKKIEWDAKNLKVTNCPEAAQYLSYKYRPGWTF